MLSSNHKTYPIRNENITVREFYRSQVMQLIINNGFENNINFLGRGIKVCRMSNSKKQKMYRCNMLGCLYFVYWSLVSSSNYSFQVWKHKSSSLSNRLSCK